MGHDHERERDLELSQALRDVACAIRDATQEHHIQFQWMVGHHQFATKTDIENLNNDLSMKISEIKTAISAASKAQKEALAEIGNQVADLKQQILELKDAATDPDVTEAEFLSLISQLQTDAQALADIVPGSPTTEPPSDGTGTTPSEPADQTPDRRFRS